MTNPRGLAFDAATSPRRREIIELIRASPVPLDAASIADRAGMPSTTARFHLDQLTAAGLVRRHRGSEKRRGRPRLLHSLTGNPDDVRDQLIRVLAGALARTGSSAAESIQAGRRWAQTFTGPEPGSTTPHGLIEILRQLGFEPETEAHEIRLRSCPFRVAAQEHPEIVCEVHRGLVEELQQGTRANGRLLPFVEPNLCVIAMQPRAAHGEVPIEMNDSGTDTAGEHH